MLARLSVTVSPKERECCWLPLWFSPCCVFQAEYLSLATHPSRDNQAFGDYNTWSFLALHLENKPARLIGDPRLGRNCQFCPTWFYTQVVGAGVSLWPRGQQNWVWLGTCCSGFLANGWTWSWGPRSSRALEVSRQASLLCWPMVLFLPYFCLADGFSLLLNALLKSGPSGKIYG